MRFLHTSDWHIGKPLRNEKRDDEYIGALAEVLDIGKREQVDCVLVAGDIFDSVAPPPEAERVCQKVRAGGLETILLVAPTTTPQRRAEIAALSTGFIYYLSVSGITGERPEHLRNALHRLTPSRPASASAAIARR